MSSSRSLVPGSFVPGLAIALMGVLALGIIRDAAQAADLSAPFGADEPPVLDQNVEFGTGWYIRGSAIGATQTQPSLTPDFNGVSAAHSNDWALEIGGGYEFNRWLRADATFTYYGQQRASGNGGSVNCPASLDPLTNIATGKTVGVLVNGNQCTPAENASLQKNLILANAYVDLGTWYGITPYIGAGVGAAYIISNQSVNYYNNSDGSPYRATLTLPNPYPVPLVYYNPTTGAPIYPQPRYNLGAQNWDFSKSERRFSFAFAFMAGFSYDITANTKLDIGYRYVNFGSFSGISSLSGALFSKQISTQEIRVGLRYMIDGGS